MHLCPCGSRRSYQACCAQLIAEGLPAPSPERLMRSRYTAYTLSDRDYIKKTMKGKALEQFSKEKNAYRSEPIIWIALEIIKTDEQFPLGWVEFKAYFLQENKRQVLHEKSEFRYEEGTWYYVDGILFPVFNETKVGRNDKCPCGSHKKFKKCCGL